MTADLHPDDLLHKESHGLLSDDERAHLDRHVEACSVCRFERQLRDDFQIEYQMAAAGAEGRDREGVSTAPRVASKGKRYRYRLWGLAAAALFVAGVSAAEWSSIRRVARERVFAFVDASVTRALVAPTPGAAKALAAAKGPSCPTSTAAPAALGRVLAEPLSVSVEKSLASRDSRGQRAKSRAVVDKAAPVEASDPQAASIAPEGASSSALLFARASDERERGAYGEAVRLYRELVQRHPQSSEAAAAQAILGRLLLDRGDAAGALASFNQYLRGGVSTLSEEAQVGRALALQKMNRRDEEAKAWSALLEGYPRSVHASRARVRLGALGSR
ncbi:MAG TPA: hypothetical protein VJT73_14465 [Polyangiaceae bacterium]|nr:hypothetical protein [Polyangiaceae bacterium]